MILIQLVRRKKNKIIKIVGGMHIIIIEVASTVAQSKKVHLAGVQDEKKWLIILFGSFIFWGVSLLLHKLLQNASESLKYFEILLEGAVIPFLLGFIISIILNGKHSWIYGAVSYVLYFAWFNILMFAFNFSLNEFTRVLLGMLRVYFFIGIVATVFSLFGGFIGDYTIKRRLRKKGRT